jgi:hypothetical protein
MDMQLKELFLDRWSKYFAGADLPITFYYSNDEGCAPNATNPKEWRCFIGELGRVRHGESLAFSNKAISCAGGKRYCGFSQQLRSNFEYFLSYGIDGELEGERYKKSPELVKEQLRQHPAYAAPAEYLICKRWDRLEEQDEPLIVACFATADVLSGLFTLANFDEPSSQGVIAPFGAGCSSIIYHPYFESKSEHPRGVLGMFDVSARPYVEPGVLTLAVPWEKFVRMLGNMDESFLITNSWDKVRKRIAVKK